jgi:hypothetical protein
MGNGDFLSVLFGLRANQAINEWQDAKAIQREQLDKNALLRARLDLMKWEDAHRDLIAQYRKELYEPPARARALQAWAMVPGEYRLAPDVRSLEPDGGRSRGADREAGDMEDDVVHLYAAWLAAGSPRRYVKLISEVDDDDEDAIIARYPVYDDWLRELSACCGNAFESIIRAYDSSLYLSHANLKGIRTAAGIPSVPEDQLADAEFEYSFTEQDYREIFRRAGEA